MDKREEWLQDIDARQRNTVFPDTVQNETRLWRNLASSQQKLTIVQVVGVALICLTLLALLGSDLVRRYRFASSGTAFARLVPILADSAIFLAACAAFFLVLRWRVRRALREYDERHRFHE